MLGEVAMPLGIARFDIIIYNTKYGVSKIANIVLCTCVVLPYNFLLV